MKPFIPSEYRISEADIQLAFQVEMEVQRGPRPFGTFNAIQLFCNLCLQELNSIQHVCEAQIACLICGEFHSIYHTKGCN